MTGAGGDVGEGQVFKFDPAGADYTALKDFTGIDGAGSGSVLLLSGQTLYGTTDRGGMFDRGTVFKLNTDGSGFSVLHHFPDLNESGNGTLTNSDGANPSAGLVLVGEFLFGTAPEGGLNGSGTIFRMKTDGSGFTILRAFSDSVASTNADGAFPLSELVLEGGFLYGTALRGGINGSGTIFKVRADGSDWTMLHHFASLETSPAGWTNSDGAWPSAGLVASAGILYGTCHDGGLFALGSVYKINTDGTGFGVLKSFDSLGEPEGPLLIAGDILFGVLASADYFGGGVYRLNKEGSEYSVIKSFSNGIDGSAPSKGLVLSGSTLYGTTPEGGRFNYGTLFELGVDGANYRVLTNFAGGDGAIPQGGFVAEGDTIYGSTMGGGRAGSGTLFRINRDGTSYHQIHEFTAQSNGSTFTNALGAWPNGSLLLSGNELYGTTRLGGLAGNGTVFRIETNGSNHQVLYTWSATLPAGPTRTATNTDGALPNGGLVMLGSNVYGTAREGGPGGSGVIFRVGVDGSDYTVLHAFPAVEWAGAYINSDGALPNGCLAFSGSTLFGTTEYGGEFGSGTVFRMDWNGSNFVVLKHLKYDEGFDSSAGLILSGETLYGTTYQDHGGSPLGTVFRVDTDGRSFAVLKQFQGNDGASPAGELVRAGATVFGTTDRGGAFDSGTIFKLNTNGSNFTVLAHFDYTNGANPRRALLLADGAAYGACWGGGSQNGGVLFRLSLAPAVIRRAPQTQTAESGSAVRFAVVADGSQPLTYQWFFDETNHLTQGTGSVLRLTAVQPGNAGSYQVRVTDALGVVTNSEALLSVIAPVPRRSVPALRLTGNLSLPLTLEYKENLHQSIWQSLETVTLLTSPQFYFDVAPVLQPERYYRCSQPAPSVAPAIELPYFVPAISLTGPIGNSVRLDYINVIGPTDAWVHLATVALTNSSQLYFDRSAPGNPPRLYRILQLP